MSAQALAAFTAMSGRSVAAPAVAVHPIDFTGARVHLEDPALGVVPAWYFDSKPRGAAAIVPLPRNAWQGGQPAAALRVRVATLHAQGVSVLLVDTRRSGVLSLWWRAAEEAGSLGL